MQALNPISKRELPLVIKELNEKREKNRFLLSYIEKLEIERDYRVEDFASFTSCIPEGCERIYDDWCSDAQDMFYNAVREQYPEYIAAKEERGDKGNHLLTLMKWMKGKELDVENVKLWRKI